MKKIHIIVLIFFLSCISSCKRDTLYHESNWIAPLIKSSISAEQISNLSNVKLNTVAEINDVSFINSLIPVPSISGELIGPLLLDDDEDFFSTARADTAILKLFIENNFPINLKSGSIIRIVNVINSELVFYGTLERDIEGKGGKDSIVVTKNTTTPFIENDLHLYIDNFSSDGSNGDIEDFSVYNNIKISFGIVAIRLNEININPNKTYDIGDTSAFTLGESNERSTQGLKSAKLTLYLKNGVPVNSLIQVYFLDENFQLVDSLLKTSNIISPNVTPGGVVIISSIKESKLTTEWSNADIINLNNHAKFSYIRARFSTSNDRLNYKVTHNNTIDIQLVAEMLAEVTIIE